MFLHGFGMLQQLLVVGAFGEGRVEDGFFPFRVRDQGVLDLLQQLLAFVGLIVFGSLLFLKMS